MLILFCTLYLVGLASLPYTIYPEPSTSTSAPRYNDLALLGFFAFLLFSFSTQGSLTWYIWSQHGYTGVQTSYIAFTIWIVCGLAILSLIWMVPKMINDKIDAKFYFLDIAAVMVAVPVCLICTYSAMTWFYERKYGQGAPKRWREHLLSFMADLEEHAARRHGYALSVGRTEAQGTYKKMLRRIANIRHFLSAVILIGYPLAIISLYKQEATGDVFRLFIGCIVHPIVMEVVTTIFRTLSALQWGYYTSLARIHGEKMVGLEQSESISPTALAHTQNSQQRCPHLCVVAPAAAVRGKVESVFIMYRRFMFMVSTKY